MSGTLSSLRLEQTRNPVMFCISVFFFRSIWQSTPPVPFTSHKGCVVRVLGPEPEDLSAHLLSWIFVSTTWTPQVKNCSELAQPQSTATMLGISRSWRYTWRVLLTQPEITQSRRRAWTLGPASRLLEVSLESSRKALCEKPNSSFLTAL